MDAQLISIIEVLQEIQEDSTVPKNVREKVQNAVFCLNQQKEVSMNITKALESLEELSDDSNVQSYTRTQILNVVSMLSYQLGSNQIMA